MTWFIYALLAALTASLSTIFTKLGVSGLNPSLAGTIKAIIMAIFFIILSSFRGDFVNISGSIVNHKRAFILLIFTGIFGALSWFFMNMALKYGKVTQVAPIDKLSIVLTVILAVVFFKETLSIKAFIGVIMIGVGALLVALF
ncbi:MAG: EamA family transporter [Sarcina sp.]